MTVKQLDAIAWCVYAKGGTWDYSDVLGVLSDFFPGITNEDDRKWITNRVGDIASQIRNKADKKVDAAFPNGTVKKLTCRPVLGGDDESIN